MFEGKPGVLVIDDLMSTCSDDQQMADLVTKHSHHLGISVLHLVQTLFPPGKFSRTISLNCHYIFAFKNCRDSLGISNLFQQVFSGNDRKYALESYENATEKVYGYLLLDLHPTTPNEFRLRTNIFPGERHISYVKRG